MQNAPREPSAILSTFIKLPFVFKTFVYSIFEWPLKTGFTVQCSPFIVLCLGAIGMDRVISEQCYKWKILQSNYRKMTIHGHFPIIPLENSMEKNFRRHNLTVLYPNLCYNGACYKMTAPYKSMGESSGFLKS